MDTLTCAIIGHLVGDYLLQNDLLALNKKKLGNFGGYMCIIHAFIWTMSVCLFAGWPIYGGWVSCILFATHFIQDRTNIIIWWMTVIGQRQFMKCDELDSDGVFLETARIKPGLGPWSIIVVDNIWHIVTIWFVWRFIA